MRKREETARRTDPEKMRMEVIGILDGMSTTLYNRLQEEKDPERQAKLRTQFLESCRTISQITYPEPLPDMEEEYIDGKKQVLVEIIEGLGTCLDDPILVLGKNKRQCLEQMIADYEDELEELKGEYP